MRAREFVVPCPGAWHRATPRTWLNGPLRGGCQRIRAAATARLRQRRPASRAWGRGSRHDDERYRRVVDVVLVEVDVVFVEFVLLVLLVVLVVVTSQSTAWSSCSAQSPHASQRLR